MLLCANVAELPKQPVAVSFDRVKPLQPDKWHHVCISHFHEKLMHSYISVVINGDELQTVNLPYPSTAEDIHVSMGVVRRTTDSLTSSPSDEVDLGPVFVLKEPLSRIQVSPAHVNIIVRRNKLICVRVCALQPTCARQP